MSNMNSGFGAVMKFNPQLLAPDELKAVFVARQRDLGRLVERIRQAPTDCAPQHVLLVGHRGMGKSTLLHRIALAVQEDEALNTTWVTLIFPEEQYTVGGLDKFWCNAIDALCEQLEHRADYADDVLRLDAINAELLQVSDATLREERAFAALKNWMSQHDKRLLLLVDSSDLLFETLAGRKGADQQRLWRLRDLLSSDPCLFWLGCSYSELEANQDYAAPFHEFFQYHRLKPLTLAEMRQTFLTLARTFGAGRGLKGEQAEQQIQQLLETQPERLETLMRLAGGNPRTTVVLYELLAAGGSDHVHSDLQRLLDDLSPLYKDRLESLPIQSRQVFATLLEHWAPALASDVAQATGLDVTTVNSQLSRLETNGLIEKVNVPNTKRYAYQACERFFNIWYLMRCAPRRMRVRLTWLVEFMRLWFAPVDLQDMAKRRMMLHRTGELATADQLDFSRALSLTLPDDHPSRLALDWTLVSRFEVVRDALGDFFEGEPVQAMFKDVGEYKARMVKLKQTLQRLKGRLSDTDFESCEKIYSDFIFSLPSKEVFFLGMEKQLKNSQPWIGSRWLSDIARGSDGFDYKSINRSLLCKMIDEGDFITEYMGDEVLIAHLSYLTEIAGLDYALLNLYSYGIQKKISYESFLIAFKNLDLKLKFNDSLFGALIAAFYRIADERLLQLLIDKLPREKVLRNVLRLCVFPIGANNRLAEQALTRAFEQYKIEYTAYELAKLYLLTDRMQLARQWFETYTRQYPDGYGVSILIANLFIQQMHDVAKNLDGILAQEDAAKSADLERLLVSAIELGLAVRLADVFAQHIQADFLRPLEMALRLADGDDQSLLSMPVEIQKMAYDVLDRVKSNPKIKAKEA